MSKLIRQRVRLIQKPLNARQVQIGSTIYTDYSRNDYLGLSHDARMLSIWGSLQGCPTGSAGSALICGYTQAQAALEKALADYLGYPNVLLVSNGYMANQLIFQSFIKRRQPVVLDRLVHASINEGARLAGAKIYRFRHLDMQDCQRQLERAGPSALVATDGIFSMDGDEAPLETLAQLCQAHHATLLLDDAHAIGVTGPGGRGSVAKANLNASKVPFLVGTFGKAFGGYGAFIASSEERIAHLISHGRAYIYTTALPLHCIKIIQRALALISSMDEERTYLHQLIQAFRQAKVSEGYLPKTTSPIQPWIIGCDEKTKYIHEQLKQAGIWAPVIRPPTVAEGSSRIRFSLSAGHHLSDIEHLCKTVEKLGVMENV